MPKLFPALPRLDRSQWPVALAAGATLAALMIPLNIGYAEVAGLPAEVGLYAAIFPMIAYAIFVTSRNVIASPDAAIAALIGSLLVSINTTGDPAYSLHLAYALSVLCGVIFLLFWLFRLGFLANYLSRAVLIGMITGIGIEVLVSQIRKMMGVSVEADGFFREVLAMIAAIPETNLYSLAVGLSSFAIVRLLKKFAPKVPGALVALVIMTVLVVAFNLDEKGVAVLGTVPAGLPRPTVPDVAFKDWVALIPGALAIVALTLSEGLLLARKYAQKYEYKIDPDQEEFAYGMSNVVAGFSGGMTLGASGSRTAALDEAGARNQWPSIVAAVIVAVVLLFFTDLLALLPKSALAGIVASAVLSLIEIGEFRELYHQRRSEFWIALVCTIAVLGLGTLQGVVIAFVLTTIEVVRRAARPRSSILAVDPVGAGFDPQPVTYPRLTAPGVVVYRFGGPLFFANAAALQEDITRLVEAHPGEIRWIILDADAIHDIDATGAEMFENILEYLRDNAIRLAVSRAYPPLPHWLSVYGLMEAIGEANFYETNREAVAAVTRSGD